MSIINTYNDKNELIILQKDGVRFKIRHYNKEGKILITVSGYNLKSDSSNFIDFKEKMIETAPKDIPRHRLFKLLSEFADKALKHLSSEETQMFVNHYEESKSDYQERLYNLKDKVGKLVEETEFNL